MKSLFVLVSLAFATTANASCISMGDNFWETVANYRKESKAHGWTPQTVVAGNFTGHYGSGLSTFVVTGVLQGQAPRTIVVSSIGSYTFQASTLPVGGTYLLAMDRDPGSGYYVISLCGVYTLKVQSPR